jgi:hypothetical protein
MVSAQMAGLMAAMGCAMANGGQLGASLRGWAMSPQMRQAKGRAALAVGLCALNILALSLALAFLPAAALAKTDVARFMGISLGLLPQWLFALAISFSGPFLRGERRLAWPAWSLRREQETDAAAEGDGQA